MLATKEKSHPGFQLSTVAPHPGFAFAISNTATEFDASVYDFCSGSLSSGYFRDAETGNDYAKNRYHQPGMGRFLTPDPYQQSAGPSNPGSWNRYAYVLGDPINGSDPSGREVCDPDEGDDCNSCVDDGSCNEDGVGGGSVNYTDSQITGTTYTCQNGAATCDPSQQVLTAEGPSSGPDTTIVSDTTTPIISISDDPRQNLGWSASPMSPNGPNPYSGQTYFGVSASCMFAIGGNNPWGNQVRGCLATMFLNTPPGTSYESVSHGDHMFCYGAARQQTSGLSTLSGLLRAGAGGIVCSMPAPPIFIPVPGVNPPQ